MSNPILSWRRVRALCVKETRQIVRDPSSWLIAVVIPLLLLFIFGYGINLDSSKLRVGILLEQRSEAALDFTHTMTGSPYIDATISDNRQELIAKMQAGKIRGLVVIPVDFAEQMERANAIAPIQVITDGSEPNTANFVQGYVEGIWQIWQMQRAEDNGQTFEPLIDVQTRYWFNPAAISQHFIIPGAVTIIMTVIGAILTSLVVAREWERGTMEALLSTEITRTELLLCKLIPYYFLGMLANRRRVKPVAGLYINKRFKSLPVVLRSLHLPDLPDTTTVLYWIFVILVTLSLKLLVGHAGEAELASHCFRIKAESVAG